MAKRKSLVAEVLVLAKPPKRGFPNWFEKLPPEAQAELAEVRQAFDPKVHEKNQYARAVMAAAAERGWKTAGRQGVIAWLSASR